MTFQHLPLKVGEFYTSLYYEIDIPRPIVHGTIPARIESWEKYDIYAHLDEHGRYRVKLDVHFNNSEAGFAYLRLRQAKPYAGNR